jgi:hypothetical protein
VHINRGKVQIRVSGRFSSPIRVKRSCLGFLYSNGTKPASALHQRSACERSMSASTQSPLKLENLRSPEKITKTLLACIVFAATFLDYWSYSRQYYTEPQAFQDVLAGTAAAPNQYRVGAIWVANFIATHAHVGLRHAMTLLDGLSGLLAVFLLYLLLRNSAFYRSAGNHLRWAGSAAFLAMVQFYLAWLIWYQRPETLPSAALVALALWLLTSPPETSRPMPSWAASIGLLAFSAAQGLVRADIAVALNLGILLACLSRFSEGMSLSRWTMAATSLAGSLISGGIQYYLMHIVYPHASYGSTPVFQLVLNITDHLRIFPFLIFMLPWVWTASFFARHRDALPGPSAALLVGSTVFLLLWCVVGKIDEVRIFLPFAVALIPATVQAAMRTASEEV